jgi:hypothetical protein
LVFFRPGHSPGRVFQPEELIKAESLSMEAICHIAIKTASHFAIYFYDCLQAVGISTRKSRLEFNPDGFQCPAR